MAKAKADAAPVETKPKRARTRIQIEMERAEEEHRRMLLRRRIEIARTGVSLFEKKKFAEAVRQFHTYLRILEDWKGAPDGGLNPAHFDAKKDFGEILVISGVYWDLVKLYDHTQSASKKKEFNRYLEKFILFSRGFTHQSLSAETLRKYISNGRPKHADELKAAYKLLEQKKCFVATELVDSIDIDTMPRLRKFRDEQLAKSRWGRSLTSLYYKVGPLIAVLLSKMPDRTRRLVGRALDEIARQVV